LDRALHLLLRQPAPPGDEEEGAGHAGRGWAALRDWLSREPDARDAYTNVGLRVGRVQVEDDEHRARGAIAAKGPVFIQGLVLRREAATRSVSRRAFAGNSRLIHHSRCSATAIAYSPGVGR